MIHAYEKQVISDQKTYEPNQLQNHYEMATGLPPSQNAPLNRLSEQEEDDDDGDYDEDVEEGCGDDVMENVSKNTTSSSFTCYSGSGNSKLKNAYPCASDVTSTYSDSLRKRNNATSVTGSKIKATKSKSVQFVPSTKLNDDNNDDDDDDLLYPTTRSSAAFKNTRSLRKIVFNGTFPIDDPYSSRF